MFQLKPISKEAINEALQKAERYRLLNEPQLAESICNDILDVDPENHSATGHHAAGHYRSVWKIFID